MATVAQVLKSAGKPINPFLNSMDSHKTQKPSCTFLCPTFKIKKIAGVEKRQKGHMAPFWPIKNGCRLL